MYHFFKNCFAIILNCDLFINLKGILLKKDFINIIFRISLKFYYFLAVPFHDLTSSPSSELKLGDSNKILCTLKSRPISTLLWKINDKLVLNDPKAFSIVSKTVGLFTNSTFAVINPISFQANTKVTCLVNGKPISRSILINSGKFYCFFIFQSQPLIFSTIL